MADGGDIYSARWVIEDAYQNHHNHAILVRDGRIADLGDPQTLSSRYPAARCHHHDNAAILPGFVNAHHHCFGVNLINQGISDDVLEPWIFAAAGAAEIPNSVATEYAALNLLKSGVTAVVDACSAGASRSGAEQKIHQKISIYGDLGMTCAIVPGERWQNPLVHPTGQTTAFLATLPVALREKLKSQHLARQKIAPDDYIGLIQQLHTDASDLDGVDVWFGPTAPHWADAQLWAAIARLTHENGLRVQTHAEESQRQHITAATSTSVVSDLDAAGMLSPQLSLAHMVWASDADLERIAQTGTHIVCNPSSNLRLKSGIARAQHMAERGINIALGMDGTSLAGDDDMFAEMRLARNLYWDHGTDGPALSARDVFDMATLGGARLLGQDHRIGSLTVGKRADFVVVDLDRVTGPWLTADADPIELLISSAKSSDIQAVYTGGALAVSHGENRRRDESALLQKISEEMERAADQRFDAEEYATLRSALMGFYDDWQRQQTKHR